MVYPDKGSRQPGRYIATGMKRTVQWAAISLAMFIVGIGTNKAQSIPAQAPEVSSTSQIAIPSGQKFIMQLETALHTRSTREGDRVEFSTAADILVENQVVIPNKSQVSGTVTKAKRAGRLRGHAEIQLRLDEVRLADGSMVPLQAAITRAGFDPVDSTEGKDPSVKGESGAGEDVGVIVQGGAQGAIIGVMTAGGKGAMVGSAAGAAIAAAGMLLRRGPDLDLPRYTMFEAQFNQQLEIPPQALPRPAPAASGMSEDARTAVAAVEEHVSPPRPRLVRRKPGEIPPAETPPVTKPPETPPAASTQPPVSTTGADQPAGAGAFKLSVNVRMVIVDAVVKDKSGRMIDNLQREDFLIFEDGKQQELQGFSRDELPLAIALVIDRSGSVSPYIAELRRIANSTLQQLKPEDEVSLFSFAEDVELIEDLTTDRQRIATALSRIRTGGGTNITDAVFEAVTYLAKNAPDRRHAVILISDNQATVNPQTSEGQTIRAAMDSDTVVYSLKTAGEARPLATRLPSLLTGDGSVGKITRETGGEIINVAGVASFDSALGSVISRLRMRYSLGYYAPDPSQGAFHSIEVRLDDRLGKVGSDYFVHARRGYYATADQKR